jgi:hypothetical protein
METAKVDIRKLQLLNDRINQCIDALHQVRLSVHALQQGYQTQQPYGMGFNPFQSFQQGPWNQFLQQQPFGFGQGINPQLFGQGQQFGQGQPFGQGINPQLFAQGQQFGQGINPQLFGQGQQFGQGQPFGQGMNPQLFGQGQQFGQGQTFNPTQQNPGLLHTGMPFQTQGLSHTGFEQEFYNRPLSTDPLLAFRVATTFPYAHFPVPPVVTLY